MAYAVGNTPDSQPSTAVGATTPPWTLGEIPLTTEMDDLNIVPDSGVDGIVNVPTDMTSLGMSTGSMSFTAQDNFAQTYLPLYTDWQSA